MRHKSKPVLIILSILLFGCQGYVLDTDETPVICIEGWIEQGKNPVVFISECMTPNKKYQPIDEAFTHSIHDATVSITIDGKQYTLYEIVDSTFTPPYIYTTKNLVGHTGCKYSLLVQWQGTTATAHTIIPEVVELDSISKKRADASSSDFYLMAHLHDNPRTADCYKVFVKTDTQSDSMFVSSFLGTINDLESNGVNLEIPIYRGRRENGDPYKPLFNENEDITIKFCHIDSCAFQYWNAFDKMMVLSRNPIITYRNNLPSNIKGGLGYWFGYGAKAYQILRTNN